MPTIGNTIGLTYKNQSINQNLQREMEEIHRNNKKNRQTLQAPDNKHNKQEQTTVEQ
jgi:hypothetical protein